VPLNHPLQAAQTLGFRVSLFPDTSKCTSIRQGLNFNSLVSQIHTHAQSHTFCQEPLVTRPQKRTRRKQGSSQQVRINVTNSAAKKRMSLYESQYFLVRGGGSLWQVLQGTYNKIAILNITQGKLANYKSMS
jgi:hypothetical protein